MVFIGGLFRLLSSWGSFESSEGAWGWESDRHGLMIPCSLHGLSKGFGLAHREMETMVPPSRSPEIGAESVAQQGVGSDPHRH